MTASTPELPPVSIPELVRNAARLHGGLTAIEEDGTRTDYAQLPELALDVCRGLMAHGIAPGNRVAVWAPNRRDWILAALGVHFAGAVLVPINTRMKGAEAADVLARSGTRLLFTVGRFLETDYPAMLAPLRPATLEHVVVMTGDDRPAQAGEVAWNAFLAAGRSVDRAEARQRAEAVGPEFLSDLLFTSGTTGKPKGVMCAHGQTVRAFTEYARVIGLRPGDRYLIVNPFFHAFGYKAGWLTCLIAGATILPHPVFDAEAVFQRIVADRITVMPGPPTLYQSVLAHPGLADADLDCLRVAVTGASTIPPVLVGRMRRDLGISVVTTAYGLTECGGLATICDPADDDETIAGTSGKPIPGTELRVVDADNRPLPAGQAGEICLRGFHVMKGYFQDAAATAEAIDQDGWLHTGDLGTVDQRGYLRITGRLKDMFIVGGFNCYPAEIEAVLAEHPAVAQVAVIGVPDERMGEVGCACVVLREGHAVGDRELIAWAREHMANYKVPRVVRYLPSLPMNASAKVLKMDLKAIVLGMA